MSKPATTTDEHSHRVLGALSLVVACGYLIWRIFWTSSGAYLPFFVALLVVDLVVILRHTLQIAPFLLGSGEGDLAEPQQPIASDLVFVVGDEPAIQVRIALRSALEVRGHVSVTVVDNSARESIAKMCARFGIRYVPVPGPAHHCAYATNATLSRRRADLSVVISGALWLSPDLTVIAGQALADSETAMVSFPVKLTSDAGLVGGDGYRITADVAAEWAGRVDASGQALPLDGPVVIRRDALRAAGGLSTKSERFILETAMRLAEGGARLRFLNAPMALRPADWDEDRALRGRAVLVAGRQRIAQLPGLGWTSPGLPGWARASHALAGLEFWASAARIVAFAMVPLVALTGRLPLTTSVSSAVLAGGTWFAMRNLTRRLLLPGEDAFAADLRRGSRVLGTDFGILREGRVGWRAGRAASAQAWATGGLLVAAALGAFSQSLGWATRPLPDLAHATVVAASGFMVWLARDSSWAVTDRQHRLLPRVRYSASLLGDVVEVSPFGIDALGELPVGSEFVVPATLPLPGNRTWATEIRAVVARHGQIDERRTSYMRFDLDERLFDELAYYCAVTAPTLRWLGRADLRAFGQPVANGRRRTPGALLAGRQDEAPLASTQPGITHDQQVST